MYKIPLKSFKEKPSPNYVYFILSLVISFLILSIFFGLSLDDFIYLRDSVTDFKYGNIILLTIIASFITLLFYLLKFDLLICKIPLYLDLKWKNILKPYKNIKLTGCLDHMYLNKVRNDLAIKVASFFFFLFILISIFFLRIKINLIYIPPIFIFLIPIISTIGYLAYRDYCSYYKGVKLIFIMNLFSQNGNMINEMNDFFNQIKHNEWLKAKFSFFDFIRRHLKQIYVPYTQKLIHLKVMKGFREFLITEFIDSNSDNLSIKNIHEEDISEEITNETVDFFLSSLNKVFSSNKNRENLYLKDFVTPLNEAFKYFSSIKGEINSWDEWLKFYIFGDEDFELLVNDVGIKIMNELKAHLDFEEFKNRLSIKDHQRRKEKIYDYYVNFLKQVRKKNLQAFIVFFNSININDFKKLLNLIKNYTIKLQELFDMKKTIKKEEKRKIIDSFKDLIILILKDERGNQIMNKLKLLRKYKSVLDRLQIFMDFSKKYELKIYLELKDNQYYILITLKLKKHGLFKVEISDIFHIIRSEKTKADIKNYLKNIANENNLK